MDTGWVLVAFGAEKNPSSILPGLGEVIFIAKSDSLLLADDGCNTTDGKYGITSDCSIAFFNAGTTLVGCGPLIPVEMIINKIVGQRITLTKLNS